MLDDFFIRAMIAGTGVAIVAGPLGCFIIWRRLAYFGDTLAHAALLGVALALMFEMNLIFAVFLISAVVSSALMILERKADLSSDALLGLLSHGALALGLVVMSLLTWIRVDLMSFLLGDILAVSKSDLAVIWGGGAVILLGLLLSWNRLFAATVSPELAAAEGLKPEQAKLAFMMLMAATIAIAMKIVGVLLITALLIIPAAAARRLSSSPEHMAIGAAILGVIAVLSGLGASLNWDTPSGPSIVVAAAFIFLLSLLPVAKIVNKQADRPTPTKDNA